MRRTHIVCCMLATLIVLLCTACTDKNAELKAAEQRKLIVEEHNAAGDALYANNDASKDMAAEYADALFDLYVYNIATPDIEDLFVETTTNEDGDSTANFWLDVSKNTYTDVYAEYLKNYANSKDITTTELKQRIVNWNTLSEYEQHNLEGTPDYYGDFVFADAKLTLHEFYGRIGNETLYEITKYTSALSDNLVVITSWQNGKITGVVRLFNGC